MRLFPCLPVTRSSAARGTFALLLGCAALLQGGCAAPMALTMMSMSASGISLITTGKSLPDHALSAALDSDCAMWRALDGAEACSPSSGTTSTPAWLTEQGPTSESLAFASSSVPAADTAPPPGSVAALVLSGPAAASAPAPVLPAQPAAALALSGPAAPAPAPAPASAPPVAVLALARPAAATERLARVAVAPARRPVLPSAPVAAVAAPALASGPAVVSAPAALSAPALAAGRELASGPAEVSIPTPQSPTLRIPDHNLPRTFTVIGSFAARASAELVAATVADGHTVRVMAAEVAGISRYRVLLGAIDGGDLAPAQARAAGFADGWPITVCTATLGPPPCQQPELLAVSLTSG